MKSIKEKQLLVKWSKAMNEPIDPILLEEVTRYESLQADILRSVKENSINDLLEASKVAEDFVEKINIDYPKPPSLDEVLEILQEQTEEIEEVVEKPKVDLVSQAVEQIKKESLQEKESFQNPDPPLVEKNLTAIQTKLKFLEQAIGKIAATGPGSGEVRLEFLDDVERTSAKINGNYLKYNSSLDKWVGDALTTGDVVNNTTLVQSNTYSVVDSDWYVGVNYAGNVTITIPASATAGRVLVIKDESGNCSNNPITASGNVDNDSGGFILAQDNGGIQMVYREGWRII